MRGTEKGRAEHVSQFIYIVNLIKQFYGLKYHQSKVHLILNAFVQTSPPSNAQNGTLDHVCLRKWWHKIVQEQRWIERTESIWTDR